MIMLKDREGGERDSKRDFAFAGSLPKRTHGWAYHNPAPLVWKSIKVAPLSDIDRSTQVSSVVSLCALRGI